MIELNPVSKVIVPAPPKSDVAALEDDERGKALTRSELAAFLAAVNGDWRMFFEFLTVTGLRIGEAVGLTWENVVLGGGEPRIKVREQIHKGKRKRYLKSEKGAREIPLSPEWVDRLMVHRRDTFQGSRSPVFASATGTPLVPSNVYRRVLAPAAIDAGLYVQVGPAADNRNLRSVTIGRSARRHLAEPSGGRALCGRAGAMEAATEGAGPVCQLCEEAARKRGRQGKKTAIAFHAFRHTCASLLFDEGRNIKQVSEWLGHSDPGFTLRTYISLLDDGLGEGINVPVVAPDDASDLHGVYLGVNPNEKSAA